MSSKRDLEGRTALVTGASSGLGAAFARLLAARGADLVITARRESNLTALAKELEAQHKVKVTTVPLDLADPAAAKKLFELTEGAGKVIDVLINNAGGGAHQHFVEMAWEQTAKQIQLNVTSLVELTWLFARAMRGRKERPGHVLNVSSIGAYTPSPSYATYSAGKAFVRDFTEAVAYELRGTNVTVTCLCPGGTLTEFHQAAGHELPGFFRSTFQTAEQCAQVGLSALFAGRSNVVAGVMNKVAMFATRFTPRAMIVWSAAVTMGEPKKPAALTEKT